MPFTLSVFIVHACLLSRDNKNGVILHAFSLCLGDHTYDGEETDGNRTFSEGEGDTSRATDPESSALSPKKEKKKKSGLRTPSFLKKKKKDKSSSKKEKA